MEFRAIYTRSWRNGDRCAGELQARHGVEHSTLSLSRDDTAQNFSEDSTLSPGVTLTALWNKTQILHNSRSARLWLVPKRLDECRDLTSAHLRGFLEDRVPQLDREHMCAEELGGHNSQSSYIHTEKNH